MIHGSKLMAHSTTTRTAWFTAIVCLVLSIAPLYAQSAPEPNAQWFPDFIDVSIVSDGMNANGVDMKVWELRSSKSIHDVLMYYKTLWGKHPAFMRYDTKDWHVIGYAQHRWFVSLQVLPKQLDTFGYLTISAYPENKPAASTSRSELPPGSKLLSNIAAKDGPHNSKTLGFSNQLSLDHNATYFRTYFSKNGWVEDDVPVDPTGSTTLLFRRGADYASVSLNRSNGETGGIAIIVEH